MADETTIKRFVQAQENVYPAVLEELKNGKKLSHWMWFIFPQIKGLGVSETSKYFSIKTIAEAKEYLAHPVLGNRLLECSSILLTLEGKSAGSIFGYPDYMKLQSSMTLFNYISPQTKIFLNVLKKYFNNKPDPQTINILNSW